MSKFTKKELRALNFRWIWQSQIGWNYERMQGLGYLSTMLPVIEKLYGKDAKAKDHALKTHSQFFNTQPAMGDIIVGLDIAIEEVGGENVMETVAAIKSSLMGPFAGIGDTIFGVIAGTVFGSIAVDMAVKSNYIGIGIWTVWNLAVLFLLRPMMFNLGYKQGVNLVTTMAHKLRALTEAAAALGVMVVGAMIPTMVGVKFGAIPAFGTTFDLQALANKILPNFGAVLLVALCYYLLGKKGMNSNKLLLIVIVIALVLGWFKLLIV